MGIIAQTRALEVSTSGVARVRSQKPKLASLAHCPVLRLQMSKRQTCLSNDRGSALPLVSRKRQNQSSIFSNLNRRWSAWTSFDVEPWLFLQRGVDGDSRRPWERGLPQIVRGNGPGREAGKLGIEKSWCHLR